MTCLEKEGTIYQRSLMNRHHMVIDSERNKIKINRRRTRQTTRTIEKDIINHSCLFFPSEPEK